MIEGLAGGAPKRPMWVAADRVHQGAFTRGAIAYLRYVSMEPAILDESSPESNRPGSSDGGA